MTLGVALSATSAHAQATSGALLAPGETVAGGTSADATRVNPALSALIRRGGLRIFHATELSGPSTRSTPVLDGTSVTYATPLPLGFGLSVGAAWLRPRLGANLQHQVSADVGLSYMVVPGLSLGARVRGTGTIASPAISQTEGVSLDLAALWRPTPWISLGVAVPQIAGPRAPTLGLLRSVTAGVALRPTQTDALTVGIDGTVTEALTSTSRASVVSALPFGRLRAEFALDTPSLAWRAMAGVELAWSNYSLGGGAIFGGTGGSVDGPTGFYATAGWDDERHNALPEAAMVVVVKVEDDLGSRGLARLLLRLERMRRDPAVVGVLFVPRAQVGGLAGADELREAFARFRTSGKHVACHLEEPTNSTLLACSHAERIAIDPATIVRAAGIRATRFFLGDALSQLGVHAQFVRIGPWKSAPEQFTRSGSSPEAIAQESSLLDSLLDHLSRQIAEGRNMTPARAQETLLGGPYTAAEAVDRHLADEREMLDAFGRSLARTWNGSLVRWSAYVPRQHRAWSGGAAVAVIHIDGDIVEGESQDLPVIGAMVGEETLRTAIEAAMNSPRVAAVVLRIDSPGGSATASEHIWRAIDRLARRKPLIVSVGRQAASGGYYVAAPAREIFVNASALTGSIGIFFGKVDISGLLTRLHVGVETSRRGPHADMDSIYRAFDESELVTVQRLITESYNLFLSRVASGRHRSVGEVHHLGEGRVFTGRMALANGLADREGGLLVALDRAAALGGLGETFDVIELPRPDAGLLALVRNAVGVSDPRSFVAALMANNEVGDSLRWLYASARAPQGAMMAMTEWPIALP
ncbi:MAG: signal peptide peptidase SppA [Deltaproteobacteria bacterium]|nr:signal peptide peptidase SppA [Deltaproteobacteria bacterium]